MRPIMMIMSVVSALNFASVVHAAEPEQKNVQIGIGSEIFNFLPLGMAEALGSFKQEDLNVTVQNFQAGGSKALQALVGGSLDAVVGFYDHTILMQAAGKHIRCVFLLNETFGGAMAVREDLVSRVKSAADLKGLTVGITSPGSSTDYLSRYYVKRAGLGPRDVNFISVANNGAGLAAIEARNIDAFMFFDPLTTQAERKGTIKLLFDGRTKAGSEAAFGGDYPGACLYLSEDFIDKKPRTVQRLANSFLRTMRWIKSRSPEDVVAKMPAGYKTRDDAINIEVMKSSAQFFSSTGQFDAKNLELSRAVLEGYDEKIKAAKVNIAKTFTNEFAEQAASELNAQK